MISFCIYSIAIWNDLATNGGDLKIDSTISEKSEEIPLDFVPGGYLAAVKEEEVNLSASTNAERDQPSVQVPRNDDSSAGLPTQMERHDFEQQPGIQSHDNWVAKNQSGILEPNVGMEHTFNTGADFDEHGGSNILSACGTEVDGTSGVKVFSDISVGDPKVITEVEEFEETLEDGSVVKRKVVRTKQEQLVTESFAFSGPDSAFDSINNEQVRSCYFDSKSHCNVDVYQGI